MLVKAKEKRDVLLVHVLLPTIKEERSNGHLQKENEMRNKAGCMYVSCM